MKRVMLPFIAVGFFCLAIASSCSNSTSAKEPEVMQMDSLKDSLEVTEKQVNDDIQKVQKSLMEVDNEFKK